jgi:hypothetical protein
MTTTITESEWPTCTDPKRMLAHLQGKVSDRYLLLLACASCRRIWHRLTDEAVRQTVELMERFADGGAALSELDQSRGRLREICSRGGANRAVWHLAWEDAMDSAREAAAVETDELFRAAMARYDEEGDPRGGYDLWREALSGAEAAVGACQAALLRDLVGDPFRPSPVFSAASLAWGRGTIARLAQAAYDDRLLPSGRLDPARLAVLADALEEGGCTDAELLGHLRGPWPHVRGCHVVDSILAKR